MHTFILKTDEQIWSYKWNTTLHDNKVKISQNPNSTPNSHNFTKSPSIPFLPTKQGQSFTKSKFNHPKSHNFTNRPSNSPKSNKTILNLHFMSQNREKSELKKPYLWTDSLNFSSSRNWSIRNTNSLLKDDIFPGLKRQS